MFFIRFFVILISAIYIFSIEVSFAASGSWITLSGNSTIKVKDIEKIDKEINTETGSSTEEKKVENRKTEQRFLELIIEASKNQWNKDLKDLYISIEKKYPDPKTQIETYTGIQKTLEFRKNKLEKSEFSDEAKYIFRGYINYMITSIDKKIKNLE